jgi:formamidopyrimidine-DNA glycosylase
MPELPEVETVANGVNARVAGDRIESVWFGSKPQTFRTTSAEMAAQLPGRRIDRVRRVGKHIVFDLGPLGAPAPRVTRPGRTKKLDQPPPTRQIPDAQWLVHLGMTGRLLVSHPDTPLPAHTHAILKLSSGNELRFVDPRRFGRLSLLLPDASAKKSSPPARTAAPSGRKPPNAGNKSSIPVPATTPPTAFGFQGPGREPLTISPEDFVELFRHRRLAIKSALLNQRLLHGVGNIYADEALFHAAIRPRRMAGRLKRAELLALRAALIRVLREAIERGGSSVSDYVDADGARGFFQLEHRVYQRTGLPCLVCGSPVSRIVLGGRSTHFCSVCQH